HAVRRAAQRGAWSSQQWQRPTHAASSSFADGAVQRPRQSSSAARPECDVAIVGGGVMGASIALHLAAASGGSKRVVVFERDSSYRTASGPLSAGGIRQQFSLPVNVELSIYGAEFLKSGLAKLCSGFDVETDVQFQENGYLLLASPGQGEAVLRENVAVQHACGADWISLMEADALSARFPWLSTEGISAGAFGERNEGYFDPWSLLQAMRQGAIAQGVTFVEGAVTGFGMAPGGGAIRSVHLADGSQVSVGAVVNAAGPFGGELLRLCGPEITPLPVVPRKRCVFVIHTGDEGGGGRPRPPDNTPLTIDPSGVYFRSEGSRGRFLCGVSPKPEDDPDCVPSDLENVDHDLFQDVVWPTLAERALAFEALKVESSWAGFYEYNTLDQNGVVGWHPEVSNLLVACGFSGHGLQQAPGVGRAVAELVVAGGFQTIDLSVLGYDRIVQGKPVFERGIY
ncbi:unnamed protein product, partial [Polarella glacialis]